MLRQIGEFYHQGEKDDTSRVWMTCWHHGGRILASCGDDKAVRVWSLVGEPGWSIFIENCAENRDQRCGKHKNEGNLSKNRFFPLKNSKISKNSQISDSKMRLECRTTLDDSHTRAVRSVAFSNDGKCLVSASFDASVVVYQQEE